MSLLRSGNILSVKPFARVPALLDLHEIQREPASDSNVSSESRHESARRSIDLAEGCMLTKSIKYTHRLVHFVNAVRGEDPGPIQDFLEHEMKIIPYESFTLDDPCNLAYLESFVHTSLDLYAFIALVPSYSTVEHLIAMVKADNDARLRKMDPVNNLIPPRKLNFEDPSFTHPEYELVALHPEHFLPRGAILPIYDPITRTHKYYMPSRDRRLRESIEPHSPRLPPFRHVSRHPFRNVNVFLVALNAEIRIRRYFRMIAKRPPPVPLPEDVLALMRRVEELVRLLYWKPVSEGSLEGTGKNSVRAGWFTPVQYAETSSAEESASSASESGTSVQRTPAQVRRRWLPEADVEMRRAHGTALMGVQDMDTDYDPALFEDSYPIDDTVELYSDDTSIENWNRGVSVGV